MQRVYFPTGLLCRTFDRVPCRTAMLTICASSPVNNSIMFERCAHEYTIGALLGMGGDRSVVNRYSLHSLFEKLIL